MKVKDIFEIINTDKQHSKAHKPFEPGTRKHMDKLVKDIGYLPASAFVGPREVHSMLDKIIAAKKAKKVNKLKEAADDE